LSFGWRSRTPNLGEGDPLGGGGWCVVKSVGEFLQPPIVTFPLSVRVSEISPLLCSSTLLFPTPPLVSQKFPHVPLGIGGWHLGDEERRC